MSCKGALNFDKNIYSPYASERDLERRFQDLASDYDKSSPPTAEMLPVYRHLSSIPYHSNGITATNFHGNGNGISKVIVGATIANEGLANAHHHHSPITDLMGVNGESRIDNGIHNTNTSSITNTSTNTITNTNANINVNSMIVSATVAANINPHNTLNGFNYISAGNLNSCIATSHIIPGYPSPDSIGNSDSFLSIDRKCMQFTTEQVILHHYLSYLFEQKILLIVSLFNNILVN